MVEELVRAAGGLLGVRQPELCVLLASDDLQESIAEVALGVYEHICPKAMIGADRELEGDRAVTLWVGHLPGVHVRAFHFGEGDLDRLGAPPALREHLGVGAAEDPNFLVLGDPFSAHVMMETLHAFELTYPGRPVVGGMASGAEEPRQSALVFDGHTLRQGVCGVALWGNLRVDTVVSQGCRPIGQHYVVTRAEKNVIFTLGGRPALEVVRDLLGECPPRDRHLAQRRGLLIGCAIDEQRPCFQQGDFLIRNPLRFIQDNGALEVNHIVRVGQTVQFQVRDEQSADADLAALLSRQCLADAAGSLVFSCNGRGTRLFGEQHHDARAVWRAAGGRPSAGLFCAGEIGPVGPRNYLHGHTASVAFFRPRKD